MASFLAAGMQTATWFAKFDYLFEALPRTGSALNLITYLGLYLKLGCCAKFDYLFEALPKTGVLR
jgi:hypothetical protein